MSVEGRCTRELETRITPKRHMTNMMLKEKQQKFKEYKSSGSSLCNTTQLGEGSFNLDQMDGNEKEKEVTSDQWAWTKQKRIGRYHPYHHHCLQMAVMKLWLGSGILQPPQRLVPPRRFYILVGGTWVTWSLRSLSPSD
ncbi:hypothetical protein Tco_1008345 [Tanacetum coccineum]